MFDTGDAWVWDFWFADDGARYHLFFLYASRALQDPERRHLRASIGHAVSDDLIEWTRVADALVHGDPPAFDEVATWTGSVVRDDDLNWYLFYTGVQFESGGRNVQRVGVATSIDLMTWTKAPENPVVSADSRWYETFENSPWNEETWRDPWVFKDPGGIWHMLITARATHGASRTRGVVGHATSGDLTNWQVGPPLSVPVAAGFGQLEVMQVEVVSGQPVLIFSCLSPQASDDRRAAQPRAAIWAAPADSLAGPFRIEDAYPIAEDDLYVGRLIQRRSDAAWVLLAFRNIGPHSTFVGGITDPMPVRWHGDRLVVDQESG